MKRDFKGIWIPKEIWLNKDLTVMEKLFLVEIDSLDNEDSCFASNDYFASFMGLKNRRVRYIIDSLINKGYLERELVYKKDSKEIEKRLLRVVKNININVAQKRPTHLWQESATPMAGKCLDNNTLYISTTIEKITNNYELIESNAIRLRKQINDIKLVVPEFVKYCVSIEKYHNNNTDLFSHFGNWLKKYDFTAEASEENITWFIKMFNEISKGDFKATKQVRMLFAKQLSNGFTGPQMRKAVRNMYSNDDRNEYHKKNFQKF